MAKGSTFKRYEYKYRITQEQYERMAKAMEGQMSLDEYGRNTINNIYFDTPDFLLIRRSLEKPTYKEKLRVRWYGNRGTKTPIYIELKKKYKGIVYKRRIKRNWEDTAGYFRDHKALPMEENNIDQEQISHELDYFMNFYGTLQPALFLGYEREAYFGLENPDFRMTFDFNIRCTQGDILEQEDLTGIRVIPKNEVLLEVKTGEGLPQWLLEFFAEEDIYRSSFSKYGTAYTKLLLPEQFGGANHSA